MIKSGEAGRQAGRQTGRQAESPGIHESPFKRPHQKERSTMRLRGKKRSREVRGSAPHDTKERGHSRARQVSDADQESDSRLWAV